MAPPAAVPYEEAWRLMLQDVWPTLDEELVCKLLCCSHAMAKVVHDTCTGKVVAYMQQSAVTNDRATWLTKHARLLAELSADLTDTMGQQAGEEAFAAALHASAGIPACSLSQARLPAMPALQPDSPSKQCTLLGPVPSDTSYTSTQQPQHRQQQQQQSAQQLYRLNLLQHPGMQQQVLPLVSLHLSGNLEGSLVDSIAATCTHLTSLRLHFNNGTQAKRQPAAAWLQLAGLQELRMSYPRGVTQDHHKLGVLSLLTQLTKLELPSTVLLLHEALPPSLQDLQLKEIGTALLKPGLHHLSNLHRLRLHDLHDHQADLLPPTLEQLSLKTELRCSWPEYDITHYLQLTGLRRLELCIPDGRIFRNTLHVSRLTQVTALQLELQNRAEDQRDVLQRALPKLPLVDLQLTNSFISEEVVQALGSCTCLTGLTLADSTLKVSAAALGQQLAKLQQLRVLSCDMVELEPHPSEAYEWQPLTAAIASISSLQLLRMRGWVLGSEQLQQLCARQQLELDCWEGF